MVFKREKIADELLLDANTNSDEFEALFQDSLKKPEIKLKVGDRVKAEILSVGAEDTIVSTGTRHDGFVATSELLDSSGNRKYKSGDIVELFVTFVRGSQIKLSLNPTALNIAEGAQEAFVNRLPVEGKVEAVNQGGFEVSIFGKSAFCPMSQMDLRRIENPEEYKGKKFVFKITKFEEGGRNIVLSRRQILEESQTLANSTFQDQRKIGDVVSGRVTRLEPFGAFIEISPGLEGLAHISELSWTRIGHPKEILTVGQQVTATISRIENEGRLKISLSLKTAESSPWLNLPSNIQSGRVVSGTIKRCMPFGAFVELTPGVEGLLPLSEMSSAKRISNATEVVQEGQEVTVYIKDLNIKDKKILLSLKEAQSQLVSATEAQDLKEYMDTQNHSGASMGSMASLFQKALDKKKN